MTNIAIPGKIISIEVEDEAPFGYAEYSDNDTGSRTVIEPTGNKLSIVKLSHNGSGGGVGFNLSDDFEIGDVVEAYCDDVWTYQIWLNASGSPMAMLQSDVRRAVHLRKIFSGTGSDWLMLD